MNARRAAPDDATFETEPRTVEASRRTGAGTLAMQALIRELAALGWNKLVSHVFADNTASRRLLGKLGFREVGVLERHGNLDGEWRDVVLVELLL